MEEEKLSRKDLYGKACPYFECHAGQRMNMLNYFISCLVAGIPGIIAALRLWIWG